MTTDGQGAYTQTPDSVAFDPELTDGEVRCFMALKSFAWTKGRAWPSQRALAKKMGCSLTTVRQHLKGLERRGHIKQVPQGREDGGQGPNVVWLLTDIVNGQEVRFTFDEDVKVRIAPPLKNPMGGPHGNTRGGNESAGQTPPRFSTPPRDSEYKVDVSPLGDTSSIDTHSEKEMGSLKAAPVDLESPGSSSAPASPPTAGHASTSGGQPSPPLMPGPCEMCGAPSSAVAGGRSLCSVHVGDRSNWR